jgi:endonuclease I
VLFVLCLLPALSSARHSYYPHEYQEKFERGQLSGARLKQALFTVLDETHMKSPGEEDKIGCQKNLKANQSCYRQESLSYRHARKELFGKLHLKRNDRGYFIKDVYCNEVFTEHDRVGRGRIPSHTKINTEHTWPQSKFTGRFSRGMQKGDLHHLFPTNSRANSIRSSYNFGDVDGGEIDGCRSSAIGISIDRRSHLQYFEPADEAKGNVARAVFYFSVRYQLQIPESEEAALRRWHNQDPVDREEEKRNDGIYEIQNNRNPFIDYPELVGMIQDF